MDFEQVMHHENISFEGIESPYFLLGLLSAFDNRFQAAADKLIGEMSWKQFFAVICISMCRQPPGLKELAQVMGTSHQNLKQILLKLEKSHGIKTVIATPHFYPHSDNLEDYIEKTRTAFLELKNNIAGTDLPNIYLGCEILYYSGISKVSSLESFTINNSNYMLLELNPYIVNKTLFSELLYLREERGIIPIIAHVERYYKSHSYKKLLEFIKENNILTQINATSFFAKRYNNVLEKLFSSDIVTYIATDSHSLEKRPPLMRRALEIISAKYGDETKSKLIENANNLFQEITGKESYDEIKQP